MGFTFPRKYLTFEELRARWKCSENDLREVIVSGALKPSVRTSGRLRLPAWRRDPVTEVMELDPDAGDIEGSVSAPQFLYLRRPESDQPFECTFRLAADHPDLQPVDFDEFCAWIDPAEAPRPCWYLLPEAMNMADVQSRAVFLLEEILRFETAHSEEARTAEDLGPRERRALLNIIGAMLERLKASSTKRESNQAVIEELVASYGGAYGISDSNLIKKFAEAARSLQSDRSK